ncbi:aspartyl/glutamyl-tRNA amidotransferase subunit B [Desulfuribacillus alkaliarsenatis]|uniref:Aspartyl/glutamyl-tRNA(Asn/Gln) amidotransferase subunit B n=1 Tax=Desulfuribacillus alkaliarsenatis TaxID=766136 RepID=A0A1E5G2G0_9FIRM|nr:aspartyl/glutamyl-tRNA amidotransferase subunit B [Desulfuribacillus alkaliarsenatis]
MQEVNKLKFETVIGLEVHVELHTKSKIFCGCSTAFGAPANSHTCPICLGHPGVLPVLNEQALNYAIKASLALNCKINQESKFDRKNYFYPDLPKAWQTSQYDKPVGEHGYIEIDLPSGEKKRIGITRVHLEEDAGKLVHAEDGRGSLVDYNRVGTPLIEIVSEPDLRSPEEARLYLEKLKAIIQYCDVSDVKMEEGSLRCDANVSIRPFGQEKFGTRAELKNMNSFRGVQKGLEYEEKRQAAVILDGEEVVQETRRWDDSAGKTFTMRSKEEAHDYRYFPEPDLVKMEITDDWIERLRAEIPELPDKRKERYMADYGLSAYDASVITSSREVAEFFDSTMEHCKDAKSAANWIQGELLGYLNANNLELKNISLQPENLGNMIGLIEKGTISTKIAKTVFQEMLTSNKDPQEIVKEKGLEQISDEGAILEIVKKAIADNPKSVEDYKAGKEQAVGFFVGQVMKATRGKANPQMVNKMIVEQLKSL